jgi:hypothetical protein
MRLCLLQVKKCHTLAASYQNSGSVEDLKELEKIINELSPGESIVATSAFSHILQV